MIVRATLGSRAARALERGALGFVAPRVFSESWANRAQVSRPVGLPQEASVVGVGGATLGGSYKTPLVLALARTLVARGEPVTVHAHGYRSTKGAARCVGVRDSARTVGDDALWLFRELSTLPVPVPVVVGRDRSCALAFAATLAPLVVSDALLQTSPERLALSILALDAERPWGAGACPPSRAR